MNIKALWEVGKYACYKGMRVLKKHAPEICMAVGFAAGAKCIVDTYKATRTVDEILDAHEETIKELHEKFEEDPERYDKKVQTKALINAYAITGYRLVKHYSKAIADGIISTTMILTAFITERKRNIALSATAAYLQKRVDELEEKNQALESAGSKEESEDSENKTEEKKVITAPVDTPFYFFWADGDRRWLPVTRATPRGNPSLVVAAEEYFQKMADIRDVALEEIYIYFGKPVDERVKMAGWRKGDKVDFGLHDFKKWPQAVRFLNGEEKDGVWMHFNCRPYYMSEKLPSSEDLHNLYEFFDYLAGRKNQERRLTA